MTKREGTNRVAETASHDDSERREAHGSVVFGQESTPVPSEVSPGKEALVPTAADAAPSNSDSDKSPTDNLASRETPADPFDPESLRLSQDYAAALGVKKAMLTIPVDKPRPEWWIRVRPEGTFHQPGGERPEPLCMVAREYHAGRTVRFWFDQLTTMTSPPFSNGCDVLLVAYYASAELGCFHALGWPMPSRVVDLYIEFRNSTNGLPLPCGGGLLGALTFFGLDALAAAEKEEMRLLAIRGGPYTSEERQSLLDYCESDVVAIDKLLPAMLPMLDLPRALLRGRSMAAAAEIEWNGIPIDTVTLGRLKRHWAGVQDRLIEDVSREYGIYEGRTFKAERFANWLARNQIPWPHLESGLLDLSDDVFRQMAKVYQAVSALQELRHTLSQMRLNALTVGRDGRNRYMLSAFRARTGRYQPSNSKSSFGPSCWLRGLIKPSQGRAIAYCDWSGQEYGIAASLSGDEKMMKDYATGDPYLAFGKRIGLVPREATKKTHPAVRDQLKTAMGLGAMYGAGPETVALYTGQPVPVARDWLRLHHETYTTFWTWSQSAVDHAMLRGWLQTVFGWRVHLGPKVNPRSLANFPMQANGAEMLRLACCLAIERGIMVCAPVHDALLVEGPMDEIDAVVWETKAAMAEASRVVLGGFELRVDHKIVRWPDRYMDQRGISMWETVMRVIEELEMVFTKCPNVL